MMHHFNFSDSRRSSGVQVSESSMEALSPNDKERRHGTDFFASPQQSPEVESLVDDFIR